MAKLNDYFQNNVPATPENDAKTSEIYKVSYKNGKNNVYKSIIRFVPNPVNPAVSYYKKYVAWVLNPITNVGMYIDNESTQIKRSPITDMYFKMVNTKNPQFEAMAKKCVSSKVQYYSLVQILQDEQHPELQGQIKVFVYGQKVFDKIHAEEFPPQGTGINPFHPAYGRRFSLVCTNQSNFNNFDTSGFFDVKDANNQTMPSGMWYINPTTGQYEVVTENTDLDVLMPYLTSNCPDLSKYDYQEWTEQQTKHVQDVLQIMNNYLMTGQIAPVQQATYQQAAAVVNTPQSPMFPGVNMNPGVPSPAANPVMGQAPQVQFPMSGQTPVAAPVTSPTPMAPAIPPVTPAAPVQPSTPTPQIGSPIMPPMGQPAVQPAVQPMAQPMGQPMVAGVEVPQVTSQAAAAPAAPRTGVNMDDILRQL